MFDRKEGKEISIAPKKKSTKYILPLLSIIILLTAMFFFFVKPSLVGYSIYQQLKEANNTLEEYTQNYDNMKEELSSTKYNLSIQSVVTDQLEEQVKELNNNLVTCLAEKSAADTIKKTNEEQSKVMQQQEKNIQQLMDEKQKEKTSYEQEKLSLGQEKEKALQDLQTVCTEKETTLKNDAGSLTQKYNTLLQNSARSICCKQKVDNPSINSYSILNDKILCMENTGSNATNTTYTLTC